MASKCFGDFHARKSVKSFAAEKVDESSERIREEARQRNTNWAIDFKDCAQYIDAKLTMLRKEMYIQPTDEEVLHLSKLRNKIAIDNAVHSIIDRHWGEE